ncbi:uncharacterized protein SCHCODRAFT_02480688, partial [Schizophyllum commune H4-8]|uniref:uncharacterized protein n=1 Tax=Schizophyllum commune (strain H4-8 / FGSC 9210) TaxID=578458 RepID=UPI00215FB577
IVNDPMAGSTSGEAKLGLACRISGHVPDHGNFWPRAQHSLSPSTTIAVAAQASGPLTSSSPRMPSLLTATRAHRPCSRPRPRRYAHSTPPPALPTQRSPPP